jgi:Protein of unknown function (DUF3617)
MFRHLNLRLASLSLALLNYGLAHSALAQEAAPATTGPDIAALVRPLVEDLNNPEYSQSRCLLAPILAGDRRTIAFSRDDTFHSRDQIVAVNGEALSTTSARALHDILVKYPPNATLSVRVARVGSESEVTAPCLDNQLYFGMLRVAATAAAQGDAVTCGDRMADAGKYHALSATWLNVAFQCNVKAGRLAGTASLAGYFEVYNQALLENEYSADALQRARPSLQVAAQKLLKAGSRPLAEKLQQAYSAALVSTAPQLADSLALKLDPDPLTSSNPGIVQKPPTVITSQVGNVTNVTIAGQLAAKNPVGCVPLSALDNNRTPPDIYLGVSACILKDDYRAAAALFALAGVESRFDAERVLDKSAGQAGQVLIMNTFNGLPEEKREKFGKAVRELSADPSALAHLCHSIRKINYPTYYPDYMVLHGIRAFIAKGGEATVDPNFNAETTWNSLLTSYLNCHDAPIPSLAVRSPPSSGSPIPKNDPSRMKPGLYQVKTDGGTLDGAQKGNGPITMRMCFTQEMLDKANPLAAQFPECAPKVTHDGNQTRSEISCLKDGTTMAGSSVETANGDVRTFAADVTTSGAGGSHTFHLDAEFTFLGTDCPRTDSAAVAP